MCLYIETTNKTYIQIDINNFELFNNKYEKLFTSKSMIMKAYCNEMITEYVLEYIIFEFLEKNTTKLQSKTFSH